MIEQFKTDVKFGLSSKPKFLDSRYFYDETGDALFRDIMRMPEYYIAPAELEILKLKGDEIISSFGIAKDQYFEFIDLGAGDGSKTLVLIKTLLAQQYDFTYIPIDISQNALDDLEQKFIKQLPSLNIATKQGTYFEVLKDLSKNNHPKVLLFLGSNIGNLSKEQAQKFIAELSSNLNKGDKVMLGIDLIKSKDIVLPAYNDKGGITKAFNLNLLNRINEELEADFVLDNFEHKPEYDESTGIAKSYLVSKLDQTVSIKSINESFHFKAGEKIDTETSKKYNDMLLNEILEGTQLSIINKIEDTKNYFADFILVKN